MQGEAMTAKSKSPSQSAPDAAAPPAGWTWATDLAHQQFAVGAEGGALLVRGLEAMRRIQEQATQQAAQRYTDASRRLASAPRPVDALAVQSELLRGDIEEAALCWQQMMGEAFEVSNELMACATRLVSTDDVFAAARLFRRGSD
jgi:hypothetical protein